MCSKKHNADLYGIHVDNVNGAQVVGGTIRVDHVAKYKKKEEGDDEEEEKRKRKEHGVYRASQI
nr:zinc finger CCCH domain-containing protein 25-like [Tanacetum cinerariifolium]